MNLHNTKADYLFSTLLLFTITSLCLTACTSGYFSIEETDQTKSFIKQCEESGGIASIKVHPKPDNTNINVGDTGTNSEDSETSTNATDTNLEDTLICVCNDKECTIGTFCNPETKECLEECTCQNDESGIGYKCNNKCKDDNSCNANGTDCGNCKNGNIKCENINKEGIIYECQNGNWQESKTRSCNGNSCNINKTGCGDCINDDLKCENINSKGVISVCNNGKWEKSKDLVCDDYPCNGDYSGCGDCDPSTFKQSCDNDGEKGNLSECINGELTFTICKDSAKNLIPCMDNTSCPSCETTEKNVIKCLGDTSSSAEYILCNEGNLYFGSCDNVIQGAKCVNTTSSGSVCELSTQQEDNVICISIPNSKINIAFTKIEPNVDHDLNPPSQYSATVCNNECSKNGCLDTDQEAH